MKERPENIPNNARWSDEHNGWVEGDESGSGRLRLFRPDGSLSAEWGVQEGKDHGWYRRYHPNGETSQSGEAVEGVLVGTASAFRCSGQTDEPFYPQLSGSVIRVDQHYQNGQIVHFQFFDAEGNELDPHGVM